MLVGVMSDSDDHLPNIRKAIEVFVSEKVDYVFHCGDFISPFTAKIFKKLNCPVLGVYGNNDGDKYTLKEKFNCLKTEIHEQPYIFNIQGRKIMVLHGFRTPETTKDIVYGLAETGKYNVILYGHTHSFDVEKINKTLVLNPGETCGYLTNQGTIALLNLEKLEFRKINL